MSDLNRVILMGHLGADPELKATADGLTLLKMRLATSEAWLDKTSRQLQERTEWHTVTLFGNRVEGLSRILHKGDCIVVEGSLRTSSWEKDGVKRYRTEIVARDICLTARKPKAAAATAPAEADGDGHDVDETLPSSTGPSSGSGNGRKPNGNGFAVPSQVLVADIPF